MLGAQLSKGSERVSAGSRKRSIDLASCRETSEMGVSTMESVGGRLGNGRRLIGGVRGPARADSQTGGLR
jgi:hypothetical protein